MSYFIDHSKKKHVKSSDSDQHVTQKLLTLKGLTLGQSYYYQLCYQKIQIYTTFKCLHYNTDLVRIH